MSLRNKTTVRDESAVSGGLRGFIQTDQLITSLLKNLSRKVWVRHGTREVNRSQHCTNHKNGTRAPIRGSVQRNKARRVCQRRLVSSCIHGFRRSTRPRHVTEQSAQSTSCSRSISVFFG